MRFLSLVSTILLFCVFVWRFREEKKKKKEKKETEIEAQMGVAKLFFSLNVYFHIHVSVLRGFSSSLFP